MRHWRTFVTLGLLGAPSALAQAAPPVEDAPRGVDPACLEMLIADPTSAENGQILTNAYSGVTLTAESPGDYPGALFGGFVPGTTIIGIAGGFGLRFPDGSVGNLGDLGVLVATFDQPASEVTIGPMQLGEGVFVMRAYDASGVQIGSDSIGSGPFDPVIGESLSVSAPGIVSIAAFAVLSDTGFRPDALRWTIAGEIDGDENEDGVVDFTDLLRVLVNFGAACEE